MVRGASFEHPPKLTMIAHAISPTSRPARSTRRVLVLAHYFPKPGRTTMGAWALRQTLAMLRAGMEVLVVSPTSWVPRVLRGLPRADAWAGCPDVHEWEGLRVEYPRWLHYHVQPLKRWAYASPERQLRLGWRSIRAKLFETVRRFAPDLLYAHHSAVNGYLALRLQETFRLPYVVIDHHFEEIRDCAHFPARRGLFERVAAGAHAIHATSNLMAEDIRRLFPRARVRVLHLGTDAIPEELRRKPRDPSLEGKLVIFAAGVLRPAKEMPLLVRAFASIAARHPSAVLRIAGDGPDRPEIEALIRRHALEGRVHLLGMQPHRVVLQEMVWSDLFALVSREEPWGVVFTEAMAAGKPIVCGEKGGILDVVEHGREALVVEEGNDVAAAGALDRLLSDEELRLRMGRAAMETFQARLSWDAHTSLLGDLFDEACQPPNQR